MYSDITVIVMSKKERSSKVRFRATELQLSLQEIFLTSRKRVARHKTIFI
jgi:hypothetical protein